MAPIFLLTSLSVCLSVYIPTNQHTYLLIYLLVWLHTYQHTYLKPIYLPPSLTTYWPNYLFICLFDYVPTNISTYLFMYLPVWIRTYELTYLPNWCIYFILSIIYLFIRFFGAFGRASSPESPAGARAAYKLSWKDFGFVCLSANAAAAAVAVVAPALVAARGRGVLFAFYYYNAVRRRALQLGHGGCQSSWLFTLAGSTTSSSFSFTGPESSASSPTVPMWRGFFFFFFA